MIHLLINIDQEELIAGSSFIVNYLCKGILDSSWRLNYEVFHSNYMKSLDFQKV